MRAERLRTCAPPGAAAELAPSEKQFFLLERLDGKLPGTPHMLVPAELVVRRTSGPSTG